MGYGFSGQCDKCGHKIKELFWGCGMMRIFQYMNSEVYLCNECEDYVSIYIYHSPEEIKKAIEEKPKPGQYDMRELDKEILSEALKKSEDQAKHGIFCYRCGSKDIVKMDMDLYVSDDHEKFNPMPCPKCKTGKIPTDHYLMWD